MKTKSSISTLKPPSWNRWRALKYLLLISLPHSAWVAFHGEGWTTFAPVLIGFVIIPILELIFSPDENNLDKVQEEIIKNDILYDLLIYIFVPIQFILLYIFLDGISDPDLTKPSFYGRIASMGVLCGVTGINLAHELGHRSKKIEIVMSKALLLTSLYMHFYIEHNRGHHKRVSTLEDPASSRMGESLYRFWFRSIVKGYQSAWQLEKDRLHKLNTTFLSLKNEMIQFSIIELLALILIYFLFGWIALMAFIGSATIGILLLETVNYIEHYGLQRQMNSSGHYEVTRPHHSWNSNHIVGRLFLFELSRHSDHHYKTNRKYQILRHHDNSPQMPTGYPGMMLLTLIPPLWFKVMHTRIAQFNKMSITIDK